MCDPWFSWRVLIRTNCLNNHWICVPRFKSSKTTSLESQRAMAPWLKSAWGKLWWMRERFARWLESKMFQATISVWFLVPQISLGFIKFAETSDAEKVLRTEIQIDRHVRPANSVDFKHAKMQWLQFGGKFCINLSEPTWSHSNRIPWDLKDHGWCRDLRPQMRFP